MTLVNDAWAEERTRLETELGQARQLEAIGKLAAGIAHDCNNLLSAIEGYAQLILSGLGPRDPIRADVEEIALAATRAAALTRQLLAVGTYPAKEAELIELTALVRGVERLLRRLLGDERTLRIEHLDGKLRVAADQGQLEQVLVNLVLNARDATPRGSTIRIRTERAILPADCDSGGVKLAAGRYARLAVLDTGKGMAPDVLARAFDLYFSTKEPDGGTGLGLPTANAIVARFGGAIVLESELQVGTVASAYLPLADTLSGART
jgi:signal transduction histidine kinase